MEDRIGIETFGSCTSGDQDAFTLGLLGSHCAFGSFPFKADLLDSKVIRSMDLELDLFGVQEHLCTRHAFGVDRRLFVGSHEDVQRKGALGFESKSIDPLYLVRCGCRFFECIGTEALLGDLDRLAIERNT